MVAYGGVWPQLPVATILSLDGLEFKNCAVAFYPNIAYFLNSRRVRENYFLPRGFTHLDMMRQDMKALTRPKAKL